MSDARAGLDRSGRGYAAAVAAAAFLSTTAIFIRHLRLAYGIPELVLAFWRALFVALTLLPALLIFRPALLKPGRGRMLFLLAYGLVLALFNSLWTLSVSLNGAAVATVLVYSSGAFTAVLGRILLREALGPAKLAAVVLGVAGCAFVAGLPGGTAAAQGAAGAAAGPGAAGIAGIATGILAGLAYAGYSLMGRSASIRGIAPLTSLLYTFAFASAVFLVVNLALPGLLPGAASRPADLLWLGSSWAGWGVLFLLAAVPTVGGFGLYNLSLSILSSSVANLVLTLEPVFTAVTAYFLLGERLGPLQIGGGVLILSGVVVLRMAEGRARRGSAGGKG
jgi:drug/metabolite transporter (DMT)-like permease